jgi:hypothetical protein
MQVLRNFFVGAVMRVLHNEFQFPQTILFYYKYIIVRKNPEDVEESCSRLDNLVTVRADTRRERTPHGKLQVRIREGCVGTATT